MRMHATPIERSHTSFWFTPVLVMVIACDSNEAQLGAAVGSRDAGAHVATSERDAASDDAAVPDAAVHDAAVHDAAAQDAAASNQTGSAEDPTFSYLYNNVFTMCRDVRCHGGGLAGFNLATVETGYASLINQPAKPTAQCAKLDKLRVVPGDPDNSLLYLKLTVDAPCGQQMPPGGQLPDAKRELVRLWIANGAAQGF
jgi:hypothetical protein